MSILTVWTALWLALPGAAPGEIIDRVLDMAATAKGPEVRAQAVKTLTTLKWRPATAEHWRKVGQIGAPALPLLDTFLTDPDAAFRKATVAALVDTAANHKATRLDVLARLARAATDDKDPAVRKAAAKAQETLKKQIASSPAVEPKPPEPPPPGLVLPTPGEPKPEPKEPEPPKPAEPPPTKPEPAPGPTQPGLVLPVPGGHKPEPPKPVQPAPGQPGLVVPPGPTEPEPGRPKPALVLPTPGPTEPGIPKPPPPDPTKPEPVLPAPGPAIPEEPQPPTPPKPEPSEPGPEQPGLVLPVPGEPEPKPAEPEPAKPPAPPEPAVPKPEPKEPEPPKPPVPPAEPKPEPPEPGPEQPGLVLPVPGEPEPKPAEPEPAKPPAPPEPVAPKPEPKEPEPPKPGPTPATVQPGLMLPVPPRLEAKSPEPKPVVPTPAKPAQPEPAEPVAPEPKPEPREPGPPEPKAGPHETPSVTDLGKQALPLLDNWLKGENAADRERGARGLATLGTHQPALRSQVVERLVRVGSSDPEPKVQAVAAEALAALQWPETDAELRQAVQASKGGWSLVARLFESADEALAARLSQAILQMAKGDAAARNQALELLPAIARRARQPAARRQVLDIVNEFAGHQEAGVAAKAIQALVELAKADPKLAHASTARLFEVATTRDQAAVRDAALEGLAELGWRPVGERDRSKLVALGPAAFPVLDVLLADQEAAARSAAVRMVTSVAQANPAARAEALERHLRVATSDRNPDVARLAVGGLRALGWPQADDWAKLVALGPRAAGALHVLLADKDEGIRTDAARALGQIGAAHGQIRAYAVSRLMHQARADRSPRVRQAVCKGLMTLGWPKSDREWAEVQQMGAGALCFLVYLARQDDAAGRQAALAKARTLSRSLLATAERNVDTVAVLHGLELQWDIDFARREAEILDLVGKGQLEHASALLGEALTECEASEKRIHGLIVESGIWPGCGVANKWGEQVGPAPRPADAQGAGAAAQLVAPDHRQLEDDADQAERGRRDVAEGLSAGGAGQRDPCPLGAG